MPRLQKMEALFSKFLGNMPPDPLADGAYGTRWPLRGHFLKNEPTSIHLPTPMLNADSIMPQPETDLETGLSWCGKSLLHDVTFTCRPTVHMCTPCSRGTSTVRILNAEEYVWTSIATLLGAIKRRRLSTCQSLIDIVALGMNVNISVLPSK